MNRWDGTVVTKIVKKELKHHFPNTKFSVRLKRYSGGSSTDVEWTNGASYKEVKELVGHYHGADFDGMQDLKYYNKKPYANDFIMFNRQYSDDVLEKEARAIAESFGVPVDGKSLREMFNINLNTSGGPALWLGSEVVNSLSSKNLA